MNFIFHYHLATSDLGSEVAGIGAMLPDLWRMANRRVRARRLGSVVDEADKNLSDLLAGIDHHLDVDAWFHQDPLFTEGENKTREAIKSADLSAEKMLLMAHITWELCLDGALLQHLGVERTLANLRRAFAKVPPDTHRQAARHHHFDRVAVETELSNFLADLNRLFVDIQAGPWISGYTHGPGLARRLGGIRRRLRLEPLSNDDEKRLGNVLEGLLEEASSRLQEARFRTPRHNLA